MAFFGGEIINPNNDHVVLYDSSDEPVDTLYLDENNRFYYKIESLNYGLHSFVHGGEYQVVILEPNDSIMIRLNTMDFDESLVFTGRGSKKNNHLIELFVAMDAENTMLHDMCKKAPESFLTSIDSLRDQKYDKLNAFTEAHPSTSLFKKVANASIDYHYYAYKEIYPFRHFGKYELANGFNSLPEEFYAFRKGISYDDEDLKDFYPYYNFLFPHINNLALGHYFETSGDTIFDRNSVHYNLNKLHLIDSLIGNESIKNNLLKYTTRNFLSYNASKEESDAVFNSFSEKCSDKEHTEYIDNIYGTLKKLQPGNRFPDVEIVNHKGKVVNINTKFEKPTVIYFWTKALKNHFKESHQKARSLRDDYPDVDFIAVNINSNTSNVWKRLLRQHNFGLEHEYRFRDPEAAKKCWPYTTSIKSWLLMPTVRS